MKFYVTANKSRHFSSVFCSQKWFGADFQVFSLPKLIRNGIPSFFSSENSSEQNSEVSSSENGLKRNSKVLSFKNGFEQISKGFSLQRNGSEWNSEVFLFRETGRIPTELPPVLSCFVFRGLIYLSENGNPTVPS
jgi:hypothetical protein